MKYQRLILIPKPIMAGATPKAIKSLKESMRSPNILSSLDLFLRVFATAPSKASQKPEINRHITPMSGRASLFPPTEKQIPVIAAMTDKYVRITP